MNARAVGSLLGLVPVLASAGTIHVPADYPTIQAALVAATSGDRVEVACGTYHEHDLVLPPGVVLSSESGDPSCVTIDADHLGRVLTCTGDAPGTAIVGLTLQGGRVVGLSGAGLLVGTATIRLEACCVVDNVCEPQSGFGQPGGGVYAVSSSLDVEGCLFRDNWGSAGGGMAVDSSSVSIHGSTFEGNFGYGTKHGGGAGGGVMSWRSTVSLSGCRFETNRASSGSGLCALWSSAVINDCAFTANVSGEAGGALGLSYSDADVERCLFVRNLGEAAAMLLVSASGRVSNCTIVRNETAPGLYAVACWGGGPSFSRCLLASNAGRSLVAVSGTVSLSCTDIYGNAVDWDSSIADQQTLHGNLSLDPLFCDMEKDDFHLQWGSPCLPSNSDGCGLVGVFGAGGCSSVAVESDTWTRIKAKYRRP